MSCAAQQKRKAPAKQHQQLLRRQSSQSLTIPTVRGAKKFRVGPYEENSWISSHGDKLITKAYTSGSIMWLLTNNVVIRRNAKVTEVYGIVLHGTHIEYRLVNLEEILDMCNDEEPTAYETYQQALPCTLRDMFETTDVHTLFGC